MNDDIGVVFISAVGIMCGFNAFRVIKKIIMDSIIGNLKKARKYYNDAKYKKGQKSFLDDSIMKYKLYPENWEKKRNMYNA